MVASEKIKQTKSKCVNETKLKKIVDCSNINYEESEYKVKERNTLRTFTNNNQEKFSSDKIYDLRKIVTDPSYCDYKKCNIVKPKEENLTYKHILKAPKRAYQNIKSIFSYSDRNKKLTDACSDVKTTNVGVIKNLTECTEVEIYVEDDTITSSTKPYSHKKYESDFPDLNSSERTDILKQKTKFDNLRDDTTAYYVDENLEGLKYQETKVAPNSNGVGISVVNTSSYSELYDLAKGFSLCSRDTTECFIEGFLNTDPKQSWVQEFPSLIDEYL